MIGPLLPLAAFGAIYGPFLGEKSTSKMSDATLSTASPYAGNEPETVRQSDQKLFLDHSEGGDQPVTVGALHINEVNGPVLDGLHFVDAPSIWNEQSGADQVVAVEQLQNLAHQQLDALEAGILAGLPVVHMPVLHRFLPGMYLREILMLAGTVLTSQIHGTEHPYMVLSGRVRVLIPGGEAVELTAGHVGITKPGTRRALFIVEDCRWLTCHVLSPEEEEARQGGATEADLVEAVGNRILLKRERADGRDIFEEYQAALSAKGLPGPHEGSRMLNTAEEC